MSWKRKVLSSLLAMALLASTANVAMALPTSDMQDTAFSRLSKLNIANGIARPDGTVDPALSEPITRAQMMAIIVRGFGAEPLALALKGATPFPDVPGNEWYSGYVTVAVNLAERQGVTIGRPGGLFDPNATVTAAEVLAFIMKFVGVQRDASQPWPQDYIQGALKAGVITEADRQTLLDFPELPASRGMAFTLADTIFASYKGLDGKSIYQTYVYNESPTITLETVPASVDTETVTITGKVEGEAVSVKVANRDLTVGADGRFSVTLPLSLGKNLFNFEAANLVGNVGKASASVERTSPKPIGPIVESVKADKSVVALLEPVTLTAYDEEGNEILEGVTFSSASEDAIVNRNVFRATQPGRYVVRAQAGIIFATTTIEVYGNASKLKIDAPDVVANGVAKKPVTVTAVDRNGVPVPTFGSKDERIYLEGDGISIYDEAGMTITEADVIDGVATFWVSIDPGLSGETLQLTATVVGNKDITGTGEIHGAWTQAAGLKVEGPKHLAANKSVNTKDAFKVYVVDQDGTPVHDIYTVDASIAGPARLINDEATYVYEDGPAIFDINNWDHVAVLGTIRLTFTVDGVGSVTHLVEHVVAERASKFTVVAPNKNVATKDFEVTVNVTDSKGVPVPLDEFGSSLLSISLPENVANKFIYPDEVELARGETSVTFKMSVKTGEPFVGDLKVTVSGSGITSTGTVNIVPGPITGFGFDRERSIVPLAAPTARFTVFPTDDNGNAVAQRNVTMKVHALEVTGVNATTGDSTRNVRINGETTTPSSPHTVKTGADGKALLEITLTPYANRVYALVLTDAEDHNREYAYVTVAVTAPEKIEVYTYKAAPDGSKYDYISTSTVNAGQQFIVKARVKDTYGGPVFGIDDDLILSTDKVFSWDGINVGDVSSVQFEEFNRTSGSGFTEKEIKELDLQEGDYIAHIYGAKAGVQKVAVRYDISAAGDLIGSKNVSVQAGDFEGLVANDGKVAKMRVNTISGPYRISLVDRFGNPVQTTRRTIDVTADAGLGVRLSQGGVNVTEINTSSTTNIYVDASREGTLTIRFSAGGYSTELEVTVER